MDKIIKNIRIRYFEARDASYSFGDLPVPALLLEKKLGS
jgi:hypothetical protein